MYAINEGIAKVNGEFVETFQRETICGNTQLDVESGTTGYKGGCYRDAGSRTYLSLRCLLGDFYFKPIKDGKGRHKGVTVACCGDDGLNALIKALEFAIQVLNDQRCEVDD